MEQVKSLELLKKNDIAVLELIDAEVDKMLLKIVGVHYDIDSIEDATEDRKMLNKLSKAINDKRIAIEKTYMLDFVPFKDKANSIKKKVESASSGVDVQVKAVEQKEKDERIDNVKFLFATELEKFDFTVELDLVLNPKWHNKLKDKEITNGIQHALMVVESDLKVISNLNSEFEDELTERYLKDLNLPITIEYKATLERAKEVAESKIEKIEVKETISEFDFATPTISETVKEYVITMKCTKSAFENIQSILKSNNIKFMV
jgi:hypothetical protein